MPTLCVVNTQTNGIGLQTRKGEMAMSSASPSQHWPGKFQHLLACKSGQVLLPSAAWAYLAI